MFLKLIKLPFTIIADVATLGGAINDGLYRNGNRSYTGKLLHEVKEEIEFRDQLNTIASITKTIKKIVE